MIKTTRQSGVAFFALLAVLGLLVALSVIGLAGNQTRQNESDQRTAEALAMAREALIGYAAAYRDSNPGEVFGYLPCPDVSTSGSEGSAETGASGCATRDVTVIGRLPWRTLDLSPLRDGDGECLWYAVSGNFKANLNKTHLMNWDTNGLIEVMAPDGNNFVAGGSGTTPDPTMRAAAVVFAPGAILPGQDRSLATTNPPDICGGNYDAANYLDTDLLEAVVANRINNATATIPATANKLTRFIAAEDSDRTTATNDSFNDQLLTIQPDEIFARRLQKRADFESYLTDPLTGMLRKAADCLLAFGSTNDSGNSVNPPRPDYKYLPWAGEFGGIPPKNLADSTKYQDTNYLLSGRLPRTAYNSALLGLHGNSNYDTPTTELLLREAMCPGWDSVDEFWENWKDHLFYAVARAHRPDTLSAITDDPCSVNECIDVEAPDGIKTEMAAVVIFAGAAQPGQSRNIDANPSYISADKADPANNLEGPVGIVEPLNVESIKSNPTTGATPNRVFSKIVGNDTIMCLRTVGLPPTVLEVDPTCGASAACTTDGNLLAAMKDLANNNTCKTGSSAISPACVNIARRIDQNNCPGIGPTYSCERAARDFLSYECLQGISSTKCVAAHTALTNCS